MMSTRFSGNSWFALFRVASERDREFTCRNWFTGKRFIVQVGALEPKPRCVIQAFLNRYVVAWQHEGGLYFGKLQPLVLEANREIPVYETG